VLEGWGKVESPVREGGCNKGLSCFGGRGGLRLVEGAVVVVTEEVVDVVHTVVRVGSVVEEVVLVFDFSSSFPCPAALGCCAAAESGLVTAVASEGETGLVMLGVGMVCAFVVGSGRESGGAGPPAAPAGSGVGVALGEPPVNKHTASFSVKAHRTHLFAFLT
jgi:hypothetical protein